MKKREILILSTFILIILASSFVSADDLFNIYVTPIKDTISISDVSQFRLTIVNNQGKADKFRIFNDNIEWDIYAVPRSDSTVTVDAESALTVALEARPQSISIREGAYYQVPLSVKSINTGLVEQTTLAIGVQSQEYIQNIYSPRINAELLMNREIDPRNPVKLNVVLENLNPRNLSDIEITLSNSIINDKQKMSLGPYEKKTVTFTENLDPLEQPKKDLLNVYVVYRNTNGVSLTVAKDENNYYEVIGYGEIKESVDIQKSFLKTKKTIVLFNDANKPNNDLYKVQAPFLRIFQSVNPEPQIIEEEGMKYYGFDVLLEPQEKYSITVVTNYRIILYLLIFAVICFGLYLLFRSPLVLTKSASNVVMREGGVTDMKIVISMKNRGYKPIEDINLSDKIPAVTEISKEFEVGTLQPSRIVRHEHKGTFVKWKLDGLESFEERIVSYTVKSRLSIIGEFKLSRAKAHFKVNGNSRSTTSNVWISRS